MTICWKFLVKHKTPLLSSPTWRSYSRESTRWCILSGLISSRWCIGPCFQKWHANLRTLMLNWLKFIVFCLDRSSFRLTRHPLQACNPWQGSWSSSQAVYKLLNPLSNGSTAWQSECLTFNASFCNPALNCKHVIALQSLCQHKLVSVSATLNAQLHNW